MKKIIIYLLFVLPVLALLSIFAEGRANLNYFKPQLEKQLSRSLGGSARIGAISLGWNRGPKLYVSTLEVYDPAFPDRGLWEAERVSLGIQLLPIFSGKFLAEELFMDRIEHPLFFLKNVRIRLPENTAKNEFSLNAEKGAFSRNKSKLPFQDMKLLFLINGEDLEIKNFVCRFSKGSVGVTGIVKNFRFGRSAEFNFSCTDVNIDDFILNSGYREGPRLSGSLSGFFEGQFSGANLAEVYDSLRGAGKIILKDGALLNYSIFRRVIQKLSMIPGAKKIKDNLLEPYASKIYETDTSLKPVEMSFHIKDRKVIIDPLVLEADYMEIKGILLVDFDKSVTANTRLLLSQNLSKTLGFLLEQLKIISNSDGQIEVPIQVRGRFPKLIIIPDTSIIKQKIIAYQTQRVITNFLDNSVSAGEAGVKNSVKSLLDSGSGIKNLLGRVASADNSN